MTTHDPFTRGSAVTILPGVPLDGVPAQRTETPAPEAQAPVAPQVPAAPPVYAPPAAPPAYAPPAPSQAYAPPAAPQAADFPSIAAPVPTAYPIGVPVPPADAALPPAGPAYVPQAQAFPTAPVFDADIPAAPAAFAFDVPAASVAAPPASPFTPTPAPAFPPADAVTAIPVQAAPFQPAIASPVPLPELDITPDDKQNRGGKRRKEGSSSFSSVKVAAVGAAVLGLAAGWFGHSALAGSDNSTSAPTPVIRHATVPHAVKLSSVTSLGSLRVLPKPWVTTGQQALLSSSVVSSTTPVYFGSASHGTYAELGVSVGTLSKVAAARGASYPAGPGGGTVNCGISVIDNQAASWCTWKDAKSSGMLARFATPTTIEAYRSTQLVRQTLEP